MSSTVDVNVLLYASDASSPLHERAAAHLERLAAGPDLVYLFWPVAMGYLRIATHPAIFGRPLSVEAAVGNLDALLSLPHVRTSAEGSGLLAGRAATWFPTRMWRRSCASTAGIRALDPFA